MENGKEKSYRRKGIGLEGGKMGRQRKGRRLKGRESGKKEEQRKEKCGWHGGGGGILHS